MDINEPNIEAPEEYEIADLRIQLTNAKDKINELTAALDLKNSRLAEETRRADCLQAQLDDDDRLLMSLLDFLQRVKDGDVRRTF